MASKKELLLKSIRELLALDVPTYEIILNLKDVGIDQKKAKELIEEAKKPPSKTGKEVLAEKLLQTDKVAKPKKKSWRQSVIDGDQELKTEALTQEEIEQQAEPGYLAEELGFEEEPEPKKAPPKPEPPKPEPKDTEAKLAGFIAALRGKKPEPEPREEDPELPEKPEPEEEKPGPEPEEEPPVQEPAQTAWQQSEQKTGYFHETPKQKLVEDITVSKLWEKGILGTVNQRLAEMKQLKEGLEKKLDKKVEAALKKEKEKIKVLFDSQSSLLSSKLDAEIEKKAKEFADLIEMKLREMRDLNKQVAESVEEFQNQKKKARAASAGLSKKIEELAQVREGMASALNSEIIKAKTQNKQIQEQMDQRLAEMDARINKTLQLENQIVEGLVKEAEHTISQLMDQKAQNFSATVESQTNQLQKITQSFETQKNQQLQTLEAQIQASTKQLNAKIERRLEKLDELQKAITIEISPQRFKDLMQELNEFKAQFVEAIQQNAEKYNQEINKINQQSQDMQKQFKLRAEKIDKKIAELDAFEKNFAKELGTSLENLTKKENNKEK